jgi:hypothetical protein
MCHSLQVDSSLESKESLVEVLNAYRAFIAETRFAARDLP